MPSIIPKHDASFCGGLLAGVALAGSLIVGSRIGQPTVYSFANNITFTMMERAAGEHPNGTEFWPSDLKSPAVLQRVYADQHLSELGLSYPEFVSAISIVPGTDTYQQVVERYRQRLADSSLSFEERRQIETEFSDAL